MSESSKKPSGNKASPGSAPGKAGKGAKGGKGNWKGKPGKGSYNKTGGGAKKRASPTEAAGGPANKKRALRFDRQSGRKHYSTVTDGKVVWNELRAKSCDPARRTTLVNDLHKALKGNYPEVALKHDASRLVQSVLEFGTSDQRLDIMGEVAPRLVELSRSTYAHFVVVKLLDLADRDPKLQQQLHKALRGNIRMMATSAVAARIVELALGNLKNAFTLRLELYGKEYGVFTDEALSKTPAYDAKGQRNSIVAAILALKPQSKPGLLEGLAVLCGKFVKKGLLAFEYVHELLDEFVGHCDEAQMAELLPSILNNALVLLSTRPGTRVVVAALGLSIAKDRRKFLKALKGHGVQLLTHRDAYLAVLRIVDVMDDTVALQRSLLAELTTRATSDGKISANPSLDADGGKAALASMGKGTQPNTDDVDDDDSCPAAGDTTASAGPMPLLDVALHTNGSKMLLRLLAPTKEKYLDPWDITALSGGVAEGTSKKAPETRRGELLAYLQAPLLALCEENPATLITSIPGSNILLEIFASMPDDVATLAAAVAKCVCSKAEDGGTAPLFDQKVVQLFLKRALQLEIGGQSVEGRADGEGERHDTHPSSLARALVETASGELSDWCTQSNRGAFVVEALLKVPAVSAAVRKELKKSKKAIGAKAKTSKVVASILELLK
uniref:PUM-HD domain-containing protein n=1 Tax=Octactis speculum TaxID=3111310 RepID=A0A7S2FGZ7_9STRA|mmetsp:Transcript_22434/g.30689  ORF Transcript_22434/g.30689 Transcript_22434/m.30689 type:complete len:670 (+) Transcript_22434:78-2087(+)|eukprot:CAMPEP_0185780126 /NCGR_PEP_ID=MMETSP1174-20130828/98073_1 /TAXON_ID=35687 /ORGANISM="Dictyocha speculum, Strain CCMP1381" /LENGTH=669 /DNA_ID=CAMNT_0028469545 /DNA_START=78 /DNA_END=2087 /DNA_ORIENTATION=-